MFSKIALIIAFIALLASGYFSYQKHAAIDAIQSKKKEKQQQLVAVNRSLKNMQEELKGRPARGSKPAIKGLKKELSETEGEGIKVAEKTKITKRNIKAREEALEKIATRLEEIDGKADKIQRVLDEIGASNIEELQAQLQSRKHEVEETEEARKALQQKVDELNSRVVEKQKSIKDLKKLSIERNELIAQNSFQAMVTAVNNEWGFVVINAGKNKGVTPEGGMLVKRSGQLVGKLKVRSLEPMMTVADIISFKGGERTNILPGDTVIFEKANQ